MNTSRLRPQVTELETRAVPALFGGWGGGLLAPLGTAAAVAGIIQAIDDDDDDVRVVVVNPATLQAQQVQQAALRFLTAQQQLAVQNAIVQQQMAIVTAYDRLLVDIQTQLQANPTLVRAFSPVVAQVVQGRSAALARAGQAQALANQANAVVVTLGPLFTPPPPTTPTGSG